MPRLKYYQALTRAISEEMTRDESVVLMGEDVGHYGGCYAVSKGLLAEFGPERIRDTPLSESAFTGAGIGAVRKITTWQSIVQVLSCDVSGGDAKYASVQLMDSDTEVSLPLKVGVALSP